MKINSTLRNFLHSYVNKEETQIQDIELFLSILQLSATDHGQSSPWNFLTYYRLSSMLRKDWLCSPWNFLHRYVNQEETEGYNIELFHCIFWAQGFLQQIMAILELQIATIKELEESWFYDHWVISFHFWAQGWLQQIMAILELYIAMIEELEET